MGVTPVHQRCMFWLFDGSLSESANCGLLGIHQVPENFATMAAAWLSAHCWVAASLLLAAMSARSYRPRMVYTATSTASAPSTLDSTLPAPSGHRSSPLARPTMYCMFFLTNPYIWSRKLLSPVQRHTIATALGNLAVSSMSPGWLFTPKYTEPSVTVSCTTLPESWLAITLTWARARRPASAVSNCPAASRAKTVYSWSV